MTKHLLKIGARGLMRRSVLVATGAMLVTLASGAAQGAAPAEMETPSQRETRMKWFNEARFGLFIHWGVYAVPAGEWKGKAVPGIGEWIMEKGKIPVSEYESLARQFNPVRFDAREWVRIAKDAGMKYIVITSKHHDGFAIFRSNLSDWGIKSTPFRRDPLKELSNECRKAGIKLCFYYSIMDWHHPDWGTRRPWHDTATGEPDMDRYVAFMKGQLKELVTRYGPLGILWFDGEWEKPWTHERGVDLYNYVRSLQPNIIVNNRVGKGRAGMEGMDKGVERVGDYGTPEQQIPATGFGPGVFWESCMTMNKTWGYRKDDQNWKSAELLIRNLVDCASKGGNYLLNVGPTAEGLIPEPSVERLKEVGQWMKVNGEAIYATTASPFNQLDWGRCTKKLTADGATLYLHVFNWPANGKLVVPGLKNTVAKSYLLADPKKQLLRTESSAAGVTITVPATAPSPVSSTVVLRVKGELDVPQAAPAPQTGSSSDATGGLRLTAAQARLHGNRVKLEHNNENVGFWTDAGDWIEWQVNLAQAGRYTAFIESASRSDSAFEIVAGTQKLRASVMKTGDYGKYTTTSLGSLELPAGQVSLAIKPVKETWKPINVRAVILKPVK